MGDDDTRRRELRRKIDDLPEREALVVELLVDLVVAQARAEDLPEAGLAGAWRDAFTAHIQRGITR
jgi:hypothetical protein